METYPAFALARPNSETRCGSVDDIVVRPKAKTRTHPERAHIARVEHSRHARVKAGDIAPGVRITHHCLLVWEVLANAHGMAVRPRPIDAADLGDRYPIFDTEPPMAGATREMKPWCEDLADRG